MPKFQLNKLVRDKFRDEYIRMGQKATCRDLSADEHKTQLIRKIIEETREIRITGAVSEIADELADIQQAVDDLAVLCDIEKEQILSAQRKKYDKKGGFTDGVYVETIELADDDEWVEYYRRYPDIFPEI
jgi:predicted house-cleaning noncanonical NTP pyrophosphatase (MazG superfamily)